MDLHAVMAPPRDAAWCVRTQSHAVARGMIVRTATRDSGRCAAQFSTVSYRAASRPRGVATRMLSLTVPCCIGQCTCGVFVSRWGLRPSKIAQIMRFIIILIHCTLKLFEHCKHLHMTCCSSLVRSVGSYGKYKYKIKYRLVFATLNFNGLS